MSKDLESSSDGSRLRLAMLPVLPLPSAHSSVLSSALSGRIEETWIALRANGFP